jgi:cation:H+ antiporter
VAVLNLVLGLLGLVLGAELAVRGALGLARHWGWPAWLTGLLLLAMGTSLPELFVSGLAAPEHPALGFGNVFGSNAFNVGMVFGIGLLLAGPRGLPAAGWRGPGALGLLVASAVAFLALWKGGQPPLWFGVYLLGSYVLVVRNALRGGLAETAGKEREVEHRPVLKGLVMLAGFAVLAWSSTTFLDGALELAAGFGWSEGFAGYLIAAIGTSAPELFTSAQAVRHGHREAVYGNMLGSNVFNLLVVGGAVTLLAGGPVRAEVVQPQLVVNLLTTLLLLGLAPFARSGKGCRAAGAVLLAFYLVSALVTQA